MRDSSANSSLRWEPCERKLTIHLCMFKQGMVVILAWGSAAVIYFHLLCLCSSYFSSGRLQLCNAGSKCPVSIQELYEVNEIKLNCAYAERKD